MFTPKSGGLNTSATILNSGDRTFTSASARAMAAVAARRRSTGVGLLSSGVRRSPFNTGGRTTPVNKSFQAAQMTESRNGHYSIDSYGCSLPALVMEALYFADKNAELSAVLAPSGWAWLVVGRRLLIWRYQQERSKAISSQFRELTLPSSDLAHRAQLVVVFSQTEGQVPSCIAVSPEGFIRYWTNISHEGTYVEMSTDLQGQECDNILFLSSSLGCFLSTTTSTIIQIQPGSGGITGAHINVNHLKPPTGILGGISRRVSSLVFGSMPTQAPEVRLVGVVCLDSSSDNDERNVAVLSARSLQKWILSPGQTEKLLYECEVDKMVYDALFEHVWGRDRIGDQLQIWLISVEPIGETGYIMILTAALNVQISQHLVYCLVTLDTSKTTPPQSVVGFSVLDHSEVYEESGEAAFLSQKFLLFGSTAFIYSKHYVLCLPTSSLPESDTSDRLEFSTNSDSILGFGRTSSFPLFFSSNHGIVSVTPSSSEQISIALNESTINDTFDVGNITMLGGDVTMASSSSSSSNSLSHLQNAFLQYYKQSVAQAKAILDDHFPGEENAGLDSAVVQLSSCLLDDIPASDPRWAQAKQSTVLSSSSTTSLIIANQIKDKILAHQYFITFLNKMGLWQRLGFSTVVENRQMPVRLLLAEHCELLHVVSELKSLHQKHSALIDSAIRFILSERGESPTGQLSNSDIFYQKISQVSSIFWGLLQAQEEVLSADVSARDAAMTIYNVNTIFLSLLKTAREVKFSILSVVPSRSLQSEAETEYVPWYSSEGPKGLRLVLNTQHGITVETGLPRAEDGQIRGLLYTQIVDLTDDILSGFQPHLNSFSVSGNPREQTLLDEYQRTRYSLLQPLVKDEQYQQALSLAEKFCDFRTLVEICEKTEDQTRLGQYMERFGSQGFSDFVFRWYLESGKSGKLLSQATTENTRNDLTKFLEDYKSIAWLHHINCGDFKAAYKTLRDLSERETSLFFRKKTMLSISKLCQIASTECNMNQEEIDTVISMGEELMLYQEQLPESVLNNHSVSYDTMRVFTPKELIYLYVSDENTCANEFDFKKALDLLGWVDESEEEQLNKMIWIKAILRDTWHHLDTDNPIEALSETLFFRTVELAFTHGYNLKGVLPPANTLLSSEELATLAKDPTFVFLIKAGYEKISEIIG